MKTMFSKSKSYRNVWAPLLLLVGLALMATGVVGQETFWDNLVPSEASQQSGIEGFQTWINIAVIAAILGAVGLSVLKLTTGQPGKMESPMTPLWAVGALILVVAFIGWASVAWGFTETAIVWPSVF